MIFAFPHQGRSEPLCTLVSDRVACGKLSTCSVNEFDGSCSECFNPEGCSVEITTPAPSDPINCIEISNELICTGESGQCSWDRAIQRCLNKTCTQRALPDCLDGNGRDRCVTVEGEVFGSNVCVEKGQTRPPCDSYFESCPDTCTSVNISGISLCREGMLDGMLNSSEYRYHKANNIWLE